MRRSLVFYVKGLIKGLGALVPFLVLYFLYPKSKETLESQGFTSADVVMRLISAFVVGLIVRKNKVPYVWVLLALLFGPLILPLLFGSIEVEKGKKPLVTN